MKPQFKQPHTGPVVVAMLGSLPPLRALSSYCLALSLAMADLVNIVFLSFHKIYPSFLYPGGQLKDDDTFPEVRHPNLRIRRLLTWSNPITWLWEGWFTRADMIHAQWWSLSLFPIYVVVCLGFRLRRKPIVFTVHNVLDHEQSRSFTLASGLLFRLSDHFIVHSLQNKTQLLKYYRIPEKRITVIPLGPLDSHTNESLSRKAARARLNIRPEEKMILLFGAVRPYKGIRTAIAALERVRRKLPKVRLVIAGKLWEDWHPYSTQIKELNLSQHVDTYLHYIPADMVSLFFTAADLVLLPYHHFDSQSAVGATAVSFRKPMIVSNVGGLPDLVGNPDSVVPPKNEAALADAIIRSLSEPGRLATMEKEIHNVANRTAWPAIAKTLFSVYKNLMRDTGREIKQND